MKITIYGSGYIGLVTGVCLANLGHQVVCLDIDKIKVNRFSQADSVLYEPQLSEMLSMNLEQKKISFLHRDDLKQHQSDIVFIAVNIPSSESDELIFKDMYSSLDHLLEISQQDLVIVVRSTVPPQGYSKIKNYILKKLELLNKSILVKLLLNPEFLKEGSAVSDFFNPDRIIVGCESKEDSEVIKSLYQTFIDKNVPFKVTTPETAILVKYASNAMLASRIAIMNEFSRLCEVAGGHISEISDLVGMDTRIGKNYLIAGIGYGGSCFSKDISMCFNTAEKHGQEMPILKAIEQSNQMQKMFFIEKINKCKNLFKNKKIALWGCSFKPNTDDIRNSPAIDVIQNFLDLNFAVNIYDPKAADSMYKHFSQHQSIQVFRDKYESLEHADALVVVTDWDEFREVDFKRLGQLMMGRYIFDARNIYQHKNLERMNFIYHPVGIS